MSIQTSDAIPINIKIPKLNFTNMPFNVSSELKLSDRHITTGSSERIGKKYNSLSLHLDKLDLLINELMSEIEKFTEIRSENGIPNHAIFKSGSPNHSSFIGKLSELLLSQSKRSLSRQIVLLLQKTKY